MKDYSGYMQKALRLVAHDILSDVARDGLTDDAYYMITFDTQMSHLPDFLRAQYPKEMTVILQHQFDHLLVDKDQFSVDLSFGGVACTLTVPFKALKAFVDPNAQFGFNLTPDSSRASSEPDQQAEIIDLASRRKK